MVIFQAFRLSGARPLLIDKTLLSSLLVMTNSQVDRNAVQVLFNGFVRFLYMPVFYIGCMRECPLVGGNGFKLNYPLGQSKGFTQVIALFR